ncbi:MAG: hypothetical protein ABW321_09220, partial [Polyangiales bacterium]
PAATPRAAKALSPLETAEQARRRGELQPARDAYARAVAAGDAGAEVAILRWARLELEAGATDRAAELLARHHKTFATPQLTAEASWLQVRVLAARGDEKAARTAAQHLIDQQPDTPQANAARRWLQRR